MRLIEFRSPYQPARRHIILNIDHVVRIVIEPAKNPELWEVNFLCTDGNWITGKFAKSYDEAVRWLQDTLPDGEQDIFPVVKTSREEDEFWNS